jgi:hypothetical protein
MDFSALSNPKKKTKKTSKMSIWLPVGMTGVAALAVFDPIPLNGAVFSAAATYTWYKFLQDRGVNLGSAVPNPRKNPVGLAFGLTLGTMAGAATVGMAALYAYKVYSDAEEREPAVRAVEEDSFLSLLNPTVGAATGAAIGYAAGQPVWKGTLYGLFFGFALRRLAVEIIHSRSKVK